MAEPVFDEQRVRDCYAWVWRCFRFYERYTEASLALRLKRQGGVGVEGQPPVKVSLERLARCVHGDEKPTCRRCTIHCYDADHRERIRAVMCYAGPRMVLRHPIDAIQHALR